MRDIIEQFIDNLYICIGALVFVFWLFIFIVLPIKYLIQNPIYQLLWIIVGVALSVTLLITFIERS